MRRLAACVLSASAFAAVAASCGVPDFQYTGGSGSSASSSMEVSVPCTGPNDSACEEQVCCLDLLSTSTKGTCVPTVQDCQGMDKLPLGCQTDADCPTAGASKCCAEYEDDPIDPGSILITQISCQASCDGDMTLPACSTNMDCPSQQCVELMNLSEYQVCSP